MKLWVDIETRSSVPIKQGTTKYSTDVEIILNQWAIENGPVIVTDMTALNDSTHIKSFADFRYATKHASEVWAHNAEFDRTQLEANAWWRALKVPATKWRCTMALARMHGLPGGLDKLCQIFKLGVDEAKDKRGYELILLFCIPRKDGRYNDRHSHPKQWLEFMSYGEQDVVAMRAIWRKCPKWNSTPRMWAIWHLDQRMNCQRGVAVDLKLAEGAVEATERAKRRLASRTAKLSKLNTQGLEETESAVEATTQRNRLLAYMAEFGVDLPDLTADTVERRLEDESLPEHIKELLRIRQQASKASTAKYRRALNQHVGGRLFNLLVFCGANRTGRWAGRTLQPQNLPRPKHTQREINLAISLFQNGGIDLYDPKAVLGLASSSLRGLIVAGPGRKLVVSDLANIEGRDMAWIAGEDWKLEAFAKYDRKEGPDLYKVSYARPFGIDPNTIADEGDMRRQIGKVMELALQYYGGVGAFCAMSETYGLKLEALAEAAWNIIPAAIMARARSNWTRAIKRRRTYGLEERTWLVCESLVLLWRDAHPATVQFWHSLDKAIKMAIRVPNKSYPVGRVVVDRKEAWLRIKLPSGRYLCYPGTRDAEEKLSFLGVNPYSKQWGRISTYSGKVAENIIQGNSADIMMDGLLAADEAGYNPILSVHDEAITEPPDNDDFTDKELSRLLVESSLWTDGMPLAAKGFTSYRYRK